MGRIIVFGNINIKLLIPLCAGIIKFIYTKIASYSKFTQHAFIICLSSSFGMSLSLILYFLSLLYFKQITKNKDSLLNLLSYISLSSSSTYSLEYNNPRKKIRKHQYKLIFLSAFFDLSQTFIISINDFINKISLFLNFWTLEISFISILAYIFLKWKFYKHQILSGVIIIILAFILDSTIGDLSSIGKHLSYFIIETIGSLLFSGVLITEKYLMEFKYINPYKICGLVGFISFWVYLFGLFLSTKFNCKNENTFCKVVYNNKSYVDNFYSYFNIEINIKEIFCLIAFILLTGTYNILCSLTIKFFQPSNVLIIQTINAILKYTDKVIFDFDFEKVFIVVIYLLIIIFLFVFNEIIEINKWGLQENTARNITVRSQIDSEDEDNDERYDSFFQTFSNEMVCYEGKQSDETLEG